jgi:hypothetical protein
VGDRVIQGIYLAPIDAGLRQECHEAADRLGYAVPCSQLLPTRWPGQEPVHCPLLYDGVGPCAPGLLYVLSEDSFAVPPEYQTGAALDSHGEHLILMAFRTDRATTVAKHSPELSCPPHRGSLTRIVGSTTVHRAQAYLEVCRSEGGPLERSLAGHVILEWSRRGVTYQMTLHGDTHINRAVLFALAPLVDLVRPS